MATEFGLLADALVVPVAILSVLSDVAILLWQVGASLVLLAVPGWLLSRRLGLLVRGAPERLVVTLAGSLAVLVVGGFGLNLTPIGLTTGSWLAWVGATTALLASGGLFRFLERRRARRVTRLVATPKQIVQHPQRLRTDLRAGQLVLLGLAALVSVGALTIARVSAETAPVGGFTELWVLQPGHGIESVAPPDGMVRVGVENHEGSSVTYRVVASSRGRSLATWQPVELRDGDGWTILAPLPPSGTIQIQLYVADVAGVYRSVHIGPEPTR